MRLTVQLLLLPATLLVTFNLLAQETDAEGCKDSAIITRMPGSAIHSCENKEYEQAKMPADADGAEKEVEGEYHSWDYGTREGVSEIQVFRNFETALKQAGFTIVYESSPGVITARKGKTWYWLQNSGSYYYQTIVTEKAVNQEVTADASSLSDELNKSGHVAVYGIHFETSKAAILADSESVLGEIVKMLQQNPEVRLSVEGHTDNVGAAAANQTLSEKRAQVFVVWLTGHGIEASRLKAKGWGPNAPCLFSAAVPCLKADVPSRHCRITSPSGDTHSSTSVRRTISTNCSSRGRGQTVLRSRESLSRRPVTPAHSRQRSRQTQRH